MRMKKAACSLVVLAAVLCLCGPAGAKEKMPITVPDSSVFLPEPPAEDSASFLRDKSIYQETRSFMGTPRWEQAAFDADLKAHAGLLFKDSFGIAITKEDTPATYAVMKAFFDADHRTDSVAKDKYKRTRPFVYFKDDGKTCFPPHEASLRENGSYPSGHTSRGWGMALLLAELSPERQDAILKRGYELGQSRVICGVHWQSDVDAGRVTGAATVARLHADHSFMKKMDRAREEIRRLRDR